MYLLTDATHGLVVNVESTSNAIDYRQLEPAIGRCEKTLERKPKQMVADGDYTTVKNTVGKPSQDTDASEMPSLIRSSISARPLHNSSTRDPVDVPRSSSNVPWPAMSKRTRLRASRACLLRPPPKEGKDINEVG